MSTPATRRQFVIGPEPVTAGDGWKSETLGSGLVLSCCAELARGDAVDERGDRWVLLGRAVETGDGPAPLEALARAPQSADAVAALGFGWAGRFALIGSGRLFTDVGALLACYHGVDAAGRAWASSSAELLARRLSAGSSARERGAGGLGFPGFPPPLTPFEGISRLLPSQVLDLSTGVCVPRPLLPEVEAGRPVDETLDALLGRMARAVQGLAGAEPPWLGLDAGAGSRLLLAAALHAGVRPRCFTRPRTATSVADRRLPAQIAHYLGLEHEAQPAQPASESDVNRAIELAEPVVAPGPDLHARFPEDPGLPGLDQVVPLARRLANVFGEPPGTRASASLEAWVDWVATTPQQGLDWRDRFHLEQRLAGGAADSEQADHGPGTDRVFPANCAWTHALRLSLPPELREGASLALTLARRVDPGLAEIPIDVPDERFGRVPALLGRLRRYRAGARERVTRYLAARLQRLAARIRS